LSPLRILILAILFYIAYRIIVRGNKKTAKKTEDYSSRNREVPADDVLEEDPVCKRLVPRRQAVQARIDGKNYYFCSDECCRAFRKEQGETK